jgi:hypothetical protein
MHICLKENLFADVIFIEYEMARSINKIETVSVGSDCPVKGYSKQPAIKVIIFVAKAGKPSCIQIFLIVKIDAIPITRSKDEVAQ